MGFRAEGSAPGAAPAVFHLRVYGLGFRVKGLVPGAAPAVSTHDSSSRRHAQTVLPLAVICGTGLSSAVALRKIVFFDPLPPAHDAVVHVVLAALLVLHQGSGFRV